MGFTIGSLFEACLLFINAIAILNEDRFLVKGTIIIVILINAHQNIKILRQ